jgi:Protein kinase domain
MIKHKNLAMLYDFSTLEDGSYYMVWEFIDGTNIQKWIAQNGPMPARLTIEIAIQALTGLDHLHSMGLIHRDISPENIMLSQDNKGKLLVKVIDFGIAKQLAEGESGQGLTQTGMFLGKLKYASPEQAGFIKEGERLDPRSDLYSFGIVMYEMLSGRAPFQATNPHGYILKHVTEKPMPIAEMNSAVAVPPKLEAIVFKSLEKSRDSRYETAAAMASAMEAIRDEVVPDQKYGLGERMITLSTAKTLMEAARPTRTGGTVAAGTGFAPTVREQKTGPQAARAATRTGSDEATVLERNLPGATAADSQATVIERAGSASAQPTVLEHLGGMGSAAPTVVEQKLRPAPEQPKKSMTPVIAIAAVVVVALAIGGYFLSRKTSAVNTAGQQQTASVPVTSSATSIPIAANQGALLLSASPYGEVEKLVGPQGKAVDVDDEKRSTPTRIDLAPGKYELTLRGPGKTSTFEVTVVAGKPTSLNCDLGGIDYGQFEKDLKQQ